MSMTQRESRSCSSNHCREASRISSFFLHLLLLNSLVFGVCGVQRWTESILFALLVTEGTLS